MTDRRAMLRARANQKKSRRHAERDQLAKQLDGIEVGTERIGLILSAVRAPESEASPSKKVIFLNHLTNDYYKPNSKFKVEVPFNNVLQSLRAALAHTDTRVRAASLRAVRHVLSSSVAVQEAILDGFDIFITAALEQGTAREMEAERLQAAGVLRQFLRTLNEELPRSLASCVVALARDNDDPLNIFAVEILCEMAIRCPALCGQCFGFQALSYAALNCTTSFCSQRSEAIVGSLLYVINTPQTRVHIDSEAIITSLLAPITDPNYIYNPQIEPTAEERMQRMYASKLALLNLLKTWQGLVVLASSRHGISSLVNTLHMQQNLSAPIAKFLVELFYAIYMIPLHAEEYSLFAPKYLCERTEVVRREKRLDLLDIYRGVVLAMLSKFDVLGALTKFLVRNDIPSEDRHLVTTLLTQLNMIKGNNLPVQYYLSHVLYVSKKSSASMPVTWKWHQNFLAYRLYAQRGLLYSRELEGLSMADSMDVSKTHMDKTWFILKPRDYSRVIDVTLDDTSFQLLLKGTKVLDAKNYEEWNWPALVELTRSRRAFSEKRMLHPHVIKLVRAILSYFRPSVSDFCTQILDESVSPATQVGVQLFYAIAQFGKTATIFADHPFFSDIVAMFNEIATNDADPLLTPSAVVNTHAFDFFAFIGALSSTVHGQRLLSVTGITQSIYDCLDKDRRDIVLRLVEELDMAPSPASDGNLRQFVERALVLYADDAELQWSVLSKISRSVSGHQRNKHQTLWAINVLLRSLAKKKLQQSALGVLRAACNSEPVVEYLSQCIDQLLEVGEIAYPLLLCVLGCENGFQLLNKRKWVNQQLSEWKSTRNLEYARHLEHILAHSLGQFSRGHSRLKGHTFDAYAGQQHVEDSYAQQVHQYYPRLHLPDHFFSKLCVHAAGAGLLKTGPMNSVTRVVREFKVDGRECKNILEVKGALWAIAHVASTPHGFEILEHDVCTILLWAACSSPILSIRGTASLCVNLLASHPKGTAFLQSQGWLTSSNFADRYAAQFYATALPANMQSLQMPPLDTKTPRPWTVVAPSISTILKGLPINSAEYEFCTCVAKLQYAVTNRKALLRLRELKGSHPQLFSDFTLYLRCCNIVESGEFSLQARRQLKTIFDPSCLQKLPEKPRRELTRHSSISQRQPSEDIVDFQRPGTAPGSLRTRRDRPKYAGSFSGQVVENDEEDEDSSDEAHQFPLRRKDRHREINDNGNDEEADWQLAIQNAFAELAGMEDTNDRDDLIATYSTAMQMAWLSYATKHKVFEFPVFGCPRVEDSSSSDSSLPPTPKPDRDADPFRVPEIPAFKPKVVLSSSDSEESEDGERTGSDGGDEDSVREQEQFAFEMHNTPTQQQSRQEPSLEDTPVLVQPHAQHLERQKQVEDLELDYQDQSDTSSISDSRPIISPHSSSSSLPLGTRTASSSAPATAPVSPGLRQSSLRLLPSVSGSRESLTASQGDTRSSTPSIGMLISSAAQSPQTQRPGSASSSRSHPPPFAHMRGQTTIV
eukprot:m.45493 g.45493  ORF g.45493 m.45493 type:complete len:1503 (-) comp10883_c0_seq1:214-4722(-)